LKPERPSHLVKNLVLGAPATRPAIPPAGNEKRKYHLGLRESHDPMMVTAPASNRAASRKGMEGNGSNSGTPLPSRIALASADHVSAYRVAVEPMGIDPEWIGYLKNRGALGLGQYDPARIDIVGPRSPTSTSPAACTPTSSAKSPGAAP
jgi:hypothetical protein